MARYAYVLGGRVQTLLEVADPAAYPALTLIPAGPEVQPNWYWDGATFSAYESIDAAKTARIEAINAECRNRLFGRYGSPEEQVSRSLGIYGEAERAAMAAGIAATIDASNVAQNAILAATTQPQVEAVTVTWPVI